VQGLDWLSVAQRTCCHCSCHTSGHAHLALALPTVVTIAAVDAVVAAVVILAVVVVVVQIAVVLRAEVIAGSVVVPDFNSTERDAGRRSDVSGCCSSRQATAAGMAVPGEMQCTQLLPH
jgi:hypothetical protein